MTDSGHVYPNMTGEATAAIYTGMTVQTVLGVCRLSLELLGALYRYLSTRSEDPVPPQFLSKYGSDIRLVIEILVAADYELSTVMRYARVVGELMNWVTEQHVVDLSAAQLQRFLDHLVRAGRTDAELRLGIRSDSNGRAVRYVAFHALRTVLDRCFQMNVTSGMRPPERPDRMAPASLESTAKLYGNIRDDREQLLLILINGLSVMPAQAASLHWNQFSSDFGTLRLRVGKPGREVTRSVQIVGGYSRALAACWERARGHGADGCSFVFTSGRGGEEPNHVTVRTLQNVLGRMVGRCGIDEHLTLTGLRVGGAWMPSRWQNLQPPAEPNHEHTTGQPVARCADGGAEGPFPPSNTAKTSASSCASPDTAGDLPDQRMAIGGRRSSCRREFQAPPNGTLETSRSFHCERPVTVGPGNETG